MWRLCHRALARTGRKRSNRITKADLGSDGRDGRSVLRGNPLEWLLSSVVMSRTTWPHGFGGSMSSLWDGHTTRFRRRQERRHTPGIRRLAWIQAGLLALMVGETLGASEAAGAERILKRAIVD